VERLTQTQFDALAELMSIRPGSQRAQAAQLVLVGGVSKKEAIERTGIARQNCDIAVDACLRGIRLARVVCGLPAE